MNRNELVVVTVIILLVAFTLGWFANWLVHRFRPAGASDMGELERLAQALHEAEETRDQALLYIESRESELMNQISQTEAELRATMEGLRDARQEAEEMRAYIEKMNTAD